jgi:hypothetical protein
MLNGIKELFGQEWFDGLKLLNNSPNILDNILIIVNKIIRMISPQLKQILLHLIMRLIEAIQNMRIQKFPIRLTKQRFALNELLSILYLPTLGWELLVYLVQFMDGLLAGWLVVDCSADLGEEAQEAAYYLVELFYYHFVLAGF